VRGILQVLYYLTNVSIVLTDIRRHRIPNKYLGLLFVIGVADVLVSEYSIIRCGESALLVIGIYSLLNYGTQKVLGYSAIGMGDIKYSACLQLFIDASQVSLLSQISWQLLMAWICGGLMAVITRRVMRADPRRIAFAPAIFLAAEIVKNVQRTLGYV
jgi:Flp pilus assembly protein protease CpaA